MIENLYIWIEKYNTVTFSDFLSQSVLYMLNISFGAGATSRYGTGSTNMMRLLATPASQHW
jgi:hypothetical protein